MSAPKTRVPAYAFTPTGATVPAVTSRLPHIRRQRLTAEMRAQHLGFWEEFAQKHRDESLEALAKLNVDFDSPTFELAPLKAAGDTLLSLHKYLRDAAVYRLLIEEEDGVVRLPTTSAVSEDIGKLSPSNRRRALGMIEQLLRRQRDDAEAEQ